MWGKIQVRGLSPEWELASGLSSSSGDFLGEGSWQVEPGRFNVLRGKRAGVCAVPTSNNIQGEYSMSTKKNVKFSLSRIMVGVVKEILMIQVELQSRRRYLRKTFSCPQIWGIWDFIYAGTAAGEAGTTKFLPTWEGNDCGSLRSV